MLTDCFEAHWAIARLRRGCTGPYLDGFASSLAASGFARNTIRAHVEAAAHAGRVAERHRVPISSFDEAMLRRFERHLRRCRCNGKSKGVFHRAASGMEHFIQYLRRLGVVVTRKPSLDAPGLSPLLDSFLDWTRRHRGIAVSTGNSY